MSLLAMISGGRLDLSPVPRDPERELPALVGKPEWFGYLLYSRGELESVLRSHKVSQAYWPQVLSVLEVESQKEAVVVMEDTPKCWKGDIICFSSRRLSFGATSLKILVCSGFCYPQAPRYFPSQPGDITIRSNGLLGLEALTPSGRMHGRQYLQFEMTKAMADDLAKL